MARTRLLYHEISFLSNSSGNGQGLPPGVDQASWEVILANRDQLNRGPFEEILVRHPFETLYCAVDLLTNEQISAVNDESFDRFLRAIPDAALEFAGWKFNKTQLKYCVKNFPNTILYYAPSLLTTSQLRRCAARFPDGALLRAASLLAPDDLVSLCLNKDALGLDQALLENAHRLAPNHFRLLLINPHTRDALARIVANGNLIEPATVVSTLLQASQSMSETELADAASVFTEIASRI